MLIIEVLEDLGYTALQAADGASGLQVLQSNQQIDLLVTDVGLPGGINGRQVADAGRSLRPDLKVLFITGYVHDATLWEEQLEPGMHLLTKPFSMSELTQRIKRVITE
jgi:CheY-like chemotaxis protein